MQTKKQVLRAMVESEKVSLQATAEAREGFGHLFYCMLLEAALQYTCFLIFL